MFPISVAIDIGKLCICIFLSKSYRLVYLRQFEIKLCVDRYISDTIFYHILAVYIITASFGKDHSIFWHLFCISSTILSFFTKLFILHQLMNKYLSRNWVN
jgi:hypothetical protein